MNPTLKSLIVSFKKLEPVLEKLEPTLTAALPVLVEALIEKAVQKLTGSSPHQDHEATSLAELQELRKDHEHLHKMVLELREEQRRTQRLVRRALVLAVTALAIGATCLIWRLAHR